MTAPLFDPAFLEAVHGFALRAVEAQRGGRLAEQRTRARGQGSDFADYKAYVPGDDLRTADWNLYRRLGRVFVRVFEERQDLPVYFLIDLSGSMAVETPPRSHAALRTTLALAAIALAQQDSVRLFPFADAMVGPARPLTGKANILHVARLLSDYAPHGGTDLVAAIDRVAAMGLRRGLAVIVSDFFDPVGIDAVVAGLTRLPHRLLLVQMTRAYDADPTVDPAFGGDVAIEDGETATRTEMTITPELVDRYRVVYRAFDDALTGFVRSRGAGIAKIDAGEDVLDQLRVLFGAGTLVL